VPGEKVRLEAAEWIEEGATEREAAEPLPDDPNARQPVAPLAGRRALALKGPGGARCGLTAAQFEELQALLDAGPAA
jgi:hypothetical protein